MADDTKQTDDGAKPAGGADEAATGPNTAQSDDRAAAADAMAAAREAARREAIADAEMEAARLAGEDGEIPDDTEDDDAPEHTADAAQLEKQVANLTDRLLRAHAENQNLHRRLERDIAESQKYGITKFARDIVAMTDNFERALSSVSPESKQNNPALEALLDGVRMIEKEFQTVLAKHHVARLDPTNEAFDPHKHQAVMEKQDPSVPAGTVVQTFQAGYEIDGRILRPAMVVVAKGGAKPVKSEQDAANETVASPDAPDKGDAPDKTPDASDGGAAT